DWATRARSRGARRERATTRRAFPTPARPPSAGEATPARRAQTALWRPKTDKARSDNPGGVVPGRAGGRTRREGGGDERGGEPRARVRLPAPGRLLDARHLLVVRPRAVRDSLGVRRQLPEEGPRRLGQGRVVHRHHLLSTPRRVHLSDRAPGRPSALGGGDSAGGLPPPPGRTPPPPAGPPSPESTPATSFRPRSPRSPRPPAAPFAAPVRR